MQCSRLSPRQRVTSPSVQRVILGAVASVTTYHTPPTPPHRAGRRILLRFNKRVGHECILFNPVLGYRTEALTKLPVPCHIQFEIQFEIKAESHRPTPANQARESCASPHPAKARAPAV